MFLENLTLDIIIVVCVVIVLALVVFFSYILPFILKKKGKKSDCKCNKK